MDLCMSNSHWSIHCSQNWVRKKDVLQRPILPSPATNRFQNWNGWQELCGKGKYLFYKKENQNSKGCKNITQFNKVSAERVIGEPAPVLTGKWVQKTRLFLYLDLKTPSPFQIHNIHTGNLFGCSTLISCSGKFLSIGNCSYFHKTGNVLQ